MILENLLKKIVKNQNPTNKDGLRIMIPSEHVFCIFGIILLSLIAGFVINVSEFGANNFLPKLLASAFVVLFTSSSWTPILFPMSFFKILGQRRVNGIIIYEIWIVMLVVITTFLTIKHLSIT